MATIWSAVNTITMRKRANTESAKAKDRIQAIVRDIVIIRDGGCCVRNSPKFGLCNGFRGDGALILQANHLVTRGKNVGFADTRLIVCMCKGHHKGYHSQRNDEYKREIRKIIGKARSKLWDRAEADRAVHHMDHYDWEKEELALAYELAILSTVQNETGVVL